MGSKSVSIDLDLRNLEWLRVQTHANPRSLSAMVNDIITQARNGATEGRKVQSVVGQAQISDDDPDLLTADAAIQSLFEVSKRRFEAS